MVDRIPFWTCKIQEQIYPCNDSTEVHTQFATCVLKDL